MEPAHGSLITMAAFIRGGSWVVASGTGAAPGTHSAAAAVCADPVGDCEFGTACQVDDFQPKSVIPTLPTFSAGSNFDASVFTVSCTVSICFDRFALAFWVSFSCFDMAKISLWRASSFSEMDESSVCVFVGCSGAVSFARGFSCVSSGSAPGDGLSFVGSPLGSSTRNFRFFSPLS